MNVNFIKEISKTWSSALKIENNSKILKNSIKSF